MQIVQDVYSPAIFPRAGIIENESNDAKSTAPTPSDRYVTQLIHTNLAMTKEDETPK